MSSLKHFFQKLREDAKSGRRTSRFGDPAKGLEYNKIHTARSVSKAIWLVDIARTPQVMKSLEDRVDVHKSAWIANRMESMINFMAWRCKGRGR